MARVSLECKGETTTRCLFVEDEQGPAFLISKVRYPAQDIVNTGAVVVVNDPAVLRRLNELKIPCRPTPQQTKFCITVNPQTSDKFRDLAAKKGKNFSSIIEELIEKWIEENDE